MQKLSINIKVVWRDVLCIMGQGVTDRLLYHPLQQRKIYLPKILLYHDVQSFKDFPCATEKRSNCSSWTIQARPPGWGRLGA